MWKYRPRLYCAANSPRQLRSSASENVAGLGGRLTRRDGGRRIGNNRDISV
jgi:hypothetical protein